MMQTHFFTLSITDVASPEKIRSEPVERFRLRVASFLGELDTRLAEFNSGLLALVVSYQVLVLHNDATPFLSSALEILNFPIEYWVHIFNLVGIIQLTGLALGFKDDSYQKVRSWISGFSSLAWFATVLAIYTTIPFVFAAALRYLLPVCVNAIMFLALSAKYRRTKNYLAEARNDIRANL